MGEQKVAGPKEQGKKETKNVEKRKRRGMGGNIK